MLASRPGDLPPPLHGGFLEGISLPDLMWALCGRRATGVLEVTRQPIRRRLYLDGGRIVFASSSDPNDRLGEMLLRQGKITLDQLEGALRKLRSGKRLGTMLVDAGALSSEDLVEAVLGQVKSVVLDVLTWEEGQYRFEPGELPIQEVITLQIKTSELLLQAIRNIRSFSRIRRSVGASRNAYALADNWREIRRDLRLDEAEALVVDHLQPEPASVESLCEALPLSNFETYRTLWALKVLGLATEREWAEVAGAEDGTLAHEGFPELFVRVAGSGDTGVLYVSRGTVERSFHLSAGRIVFATSNQPDDGLVSYLLRRGVISLRDREETSKRLLSNKRVGTILREIGVIDDRDLTGMVRQQLSAIVYDTFPWEAGDYCFVPGSLPSNEEITLDTPVASLVAEGVRRVNSWTRVIRGCGGVDNLLSLTPSYLEILDQMEAGVEEWEVANALKHPKSPRRVCRLLELGDFRVCQVLWTLRLLGALEPASIESAEELPEELPEPGYAEPAAIAAGDRASEVCDALRELPDNAHLLSRHPVDADGVVRLWEQPTAEPEDLQAELPPAVEDAVGRFNAMHRLVYRAVRVEIGAGAVNFVRACCGRVAATMGGPDPLEGVNLHSDGSWDAEGLRKVILDDGIEDPWPVYEKLLDQEFVLLEPHLGATRAAELRQEIWALAQGAPGA